MEKTKKMTDRLRDEVARHLDEHIMNQESEEYWTQDFAMLIEDFGRLLVEASNEYL